MRKAEWANTDSRVEIIAEGREVTVHVVYEGDWNFTEEASATLSVNDFFDLMHNAQRAIVDEGMRRKDA